MAGGTTGERVRPAGPRAPERALPVRGPWVWLLPVLVAVPVTAWRYDTKPLWRDEFYSLATAAREYPVMLRGLLVTDAGMGPWYALLRPWVLLSQDEAWLRLPGALAGVLACALTALVAARLAGPVAGAAAGVLLAVVPLVAQHTQEARPYPVVLACLAATAYGLLRDRDTPRTRWLLLWTAGATGAAALHVLTGGPAAVALVGWALLFPGRARRVRLALAGALPAAVCAGMVAVGVWQAPDRIPEGFPLLARTAGLWHAFAGTPPALLALAVLCAAGAAALRRDPPALVLVLTWALVPVAAVVASAAAGQLFDSRYTVGAAPGLAVLAGVGAAALARRRAHGPGARRARPAVAALLVAAVVACQVPRIAVIRHRPFSTDDVRSAAAVVAGNARPGDAVVHLGNTSRPMLRYYLPAGVSLDDVLLVRDPLRAVSVGGDELPEQARAAALAGRGRVWLVGVELGEPWEQVFAASVRPARQGRVLELGGSHGRYRVELWTVR
ncbi:hypothetical protein NUM3379_08510 [Kineococcus sp. NUM-3379]